MNAREERGLVIAGTQKLTQKGKIWLVPSQSGRGRYTVHPDAETPFCSCPDHEETGQPCKHIFAVRFTVNREQKTDGTIVETKSVSFTEKKVYRQDWPMYNMAQMEEKRRFQVLLSDLCRGLSNPPQPKTGRRRTAMSDQVFTVCLKVYSGLSSRRYGTDLEEAHGKGYVSHPINPMMACTFLESDLLTPVLQDLIVRSSLPLKSIETTFAPDSTGFSTSRFVKWFDEKYATFRSGKDWVKAHAMVGTKTHVITAVEILDRDAADCPQFKPLVEQTAKNFSVKEVPADKAYLSHDNLDLIQKLGGAAYIPFKSNSQPGESDTLWTKLFHYYNLRREDFLKHYRQRSNAESAFSMIKAKFRDHVRSKTTTAMKNEVLAKILCHNICVLIQSQVELGIEAVFWGEQEAAVPIGTAAKEIQAEVVPAPEPKASAPVAIAPVARTYQPFVGA